MNWVLPFSIGALLGILVVASQLAAMQVQCKSENKKDCLIMAVVKE